MKFVSKDELNEYTNAFMVGGIKGGIVGTAISGGLFMYARKRLPNYHKYGAFARTFFLMAPPILLGVTNMELEAQRYERQHYQYGEFSEDSKKKQEEYEHMNNWQKAKFLAGDNKYKLITGIWASSLAGSFYIINRDKLMTKSQKIVQARMYAQGLTVILLLATMALSVSAGEQRNTEWAAADQDWEKIVEAEEKREKAHNIPTLLSEQRKAKSNGQAQAQA